MDRPDVAGFFDAATNTISYVVRDPGSRACAIVDPVMDFDQAAGRISFAGADAIAAHVRAHGLEVQWIVETHVHADHLSAAQYLRERLGGRVAIGERITVVQESFGRIFDEGPGFRRDGSQFDRLLDDGERFAVGALVVRRAASARSSWGSPGSTARSRKKLIWRPRS